MAADRKLALDAEACRILSERGFTSQEVRQYLDHRLQSDLRDQFAMAVLPSAMTSKISYSEAAEISYRAADAMLVRRAKP